MRAYTRQFVAIASGALVLGALAGCSIGTAELDSPSSAPIGEAPANSSTPTAQAAGEPDTVFDGSDTAEWAKAATATSISEVEFLSLSGHLDTATALANSSTDTTLPVGTYTYSFACRGNADITFTATNGGTETDLSGPCTDQRLSGKFVATEPGVVVSASSASEPIDWAFKLSAPRKG